jgi:hypothetical protein
MKQYRVIILLFLGILGCTEELKVDFGEPSKKIVLYPFLTNDKKITIKMSAPTGILSNNFPTLNNATVIITNNNVPVDTVKIDSKGNGNSKIVPIPNHEYKFLARAEGYPEAICIAKLPGPVEALSIDTAYIDFQYSKYMRARLRIKDDPKTINYYKATIIRKGFIPIHIQIGEYPNIVTYDSTRIRIFKPQLYANIPDLGFFYSSINSFFMAQDVIDFSEAPSFKYELGSEIFFQGSEFYFPDDLFNGKVFILDILVGPEIKSYAPEKYMIELSSISEDYYKGFKSYARYGTKEQADLPVVEEVSIYSAVNGGYGFPIAYTSVIDSSYWMQQY